MPPGERPPITYRELAPTELDRIDEIDRSEVIDQVYRLRDGALVIEDEGWNGQGWRGWPAETHQRIRHCLARGGAAWAAFEGDRLIGVSVLDGRPIGPDLATLDLYFLHVTNGRRGLGIGAHLVRLAATGARDLGARRLYVSATPSINTVTFYRNRGFQLTQTPDPELLALEPDDIHMELSLQPG